ncbi:MAG: DUF3575 domain-containing protein [Flavobacteriaceae bacterium]|nr:DUF3575 domain-containing protein [Flavobacteriaceae bacterium]
MKKLIFSLFFLSIIGMTVAQNSENVANLKKHEVKINGLVLASSTAIDLTYEYVKNPATGFGVSVLWNVRDKEFPMSRFAVTPFYRVYFFSKKDYGANGLFVEGFMKMAFVKSEYPHDYTEEIKKQKTPEFNTALGISVGKKWVNKANYSFEIFAGMGATIYTPNKVNGLPRIGICIGKRF